MDGGYSSAYLGQRLPRPAPANAQRRRDRAVTAVDTVFAQPVQPDDHQRLGAGNVEQRMFEHRALSGAELMSASTTIGAPDPVLTTSR